MANDHQTHKSERNYTNIKTVTITFAFRSIICLKYLINFFNSAFTYISPTIATMLDPNFFTFNRKLSSRMRPLQINCALESNHAKILIH
jgi:hypothetical protein